MGAEYEKDSLSLFGTVAMGTGVMIGAGIFALTGQVAQFAGALFPAAFMLAAIISGFSAYSYIKVSSAYPSAGGIAMILKKAYGQSTITGAASLLMAFSMIINEALVARTFGVYALHPFDVEAGSWLVPLLAVGLIAVAFLINIAGNEVIGNASKVTSGIKVLGILAFAGVTLWFADFGFRPARALGSGYEAGPGGLLAGVAMAILAYKGFTTITNSGDEVQDPEKNVGRAIVISLVICLLVYLIVSWAVGSTLTIEEIVEARDYALAAASEPGLGRHGTWFTVAIAILATASGLLASLFAVSRMLAMLTDMDLIPHRHFGMPGDIQKHVLVYTVVVAALLAAFFEIGRIASLGAVFYLVMDIAIHWGVFRHLRDDVDARGWVLITAIVLDVVVLGAFLVIEALNDPLIIGVSLGGIVAITAFERLYLARVRDGEVRDPAG